MKIKCSDCGKILRVGGRIWIHRLHRCAQDARGNYLGYRCDQCATKYESGEDY